MNDDYVFEFLEREPILLSYLSQSDEKLKLQLRYIR